VVIAPYLSTANLSRTPVLAQPWNFEFNARLEQQISDVSVSPLVTNPPTSTETHVFSVRHPNSIIRAGALEGAADLDKGVSGGLLAAYLPNHTAHWAAPVDITLKRLQDEVFTATPVVLLFADGEILSLSAPVDLGIIEGFVTRRSKSSIRP